MKPKVTPSQLDLWSGNMSTLYNSLEGDIIRIITKRLKTGHEDITYWQAQKLSELGLFNRDVSRLLAEVTNVAESEIIKMFEETGLNIVKDIDGQLDLPRKPIPNNLDVTMRAYSNQAWLDIDNYINQTLITTTYGVGSAAIAYQQVLNQTAAAFNTGIYTFEQALERSISQLAQKGIMSTFTDKGGRVWNIESYVRTVLKSTLANTYDAQRKERMEEYGVHTVVVTSHAGARTACTLIQGEVVDLRQPYEIPEDAEYKSIYDTSWMADYLEPGGHRGINCAHMHIPFIPGVNTNNQPKFDDELNDEVRKNRDTQRRIEREIVKYKKNLMVADSLGSDQAKHWQQMVRKRQSAMRNHLDTNGDYLRRNYKREKVYVPLDVLLKDFSYYD